jgi:hypothetical protein
MECSLIFGATTVYAEVRTSFLVALYLAEAVATIT